MTKALEWTKHNRLLLLLFAAGAMVRLIYLGSIPGGLNQDEASIGYEAYSILHYGIDRNGVSVPMHLIAWGSGQNALYAYLSMPFIYLFGLNVLSVRAVSMVFGLISMVLFYLIATHLFKRRDAAAIAAFLIIICPWHIMISRWALESNIFPSLVLAAVYFLFKAVEQPKWLIGFTITIAASLYAYGTAYFFVPVFVLGITVLFIVKRTFKLHTLLWNAAVLIILSLPILLFLLINRLNGKTIELVLFSIPKLTVPRVEQISTAFQGEALTMLLHNFRQFLNLFLTQNDGLLWNAIPSYGYLYSIALPFIGIGIIVVSKIVFKRIEVKPAIIAIWTITAIAMTFITDVNINRVNIIFYPLIMLAVYGIVWLRHKIKALFIAAVAAFSISFIFFCVNYFTEYPQKISPLFYESFGEAVEYASDATDGNVYVTDKVMMPYIYVLFYEKINPHHFLSTVNYINPGGQFQFVKSFGRYYFEQPQIRQGEEAAYIYSNRDQLPAEEAGYKIKRFKHYTVVSGMGSVAERKIHDQFKNGGFEEGLLFWDFTSGTGVGTNRPINGTQLLYLDPGQTKQVSQTFRSSQAGEFVLSAQVSADAEGGKLGVSVNGVMQAEADISIQKAYQLVQLPAVQVQANDTISVYFIGGQGWLNVDDVQWTIAKPIE